MTYIVFRREMYVQVVSNFITSQTMQIIYLHTQLTDFLMLAMRNHMSKLIKKSHCQRLPPFASRNMLGIEFFHSPPTEEFDF